MSLKEMILHLHYRCKSSKSIMFLSCMILTTLYSQDGNEGNVLLIVLSLGCLSLTVHNGVEYKAHLFGQLDFSGLKV